MAFSGEIGLVRLYQSGIGIGRIRGLIRGWIRGRIRGLIHNAIHEYGSVLV
jgi:hypothetical protein